MSEGEEAAAIAALCGLSRKGPSEAEASGTAGNGIGANGHGDPAALARWNPLGVPPGGALVHGHLVSNGDDTLQRRRQRDDGFSKHGAPLRASASARHCSQHFSYPLPAGWTRAEDNLILQTVQEVRAPAPSSRRLPLTPPAALSVRRLARSGHASRPSSLAALTTPCAIDTSG